MTKLENLTSVQYQAIMEAIEQYKTNTDPTVSDMGAKYDNSELLAAIYEVESMIAVANCPKF